ncbi:MAG: polysaccharide deacetylase family protein [Chloroflexi bacterium]|nr:polysaccharide deacetylase family protein [Chloroflexota bacterium]
MSSAPIFSWPQGCEGAISLTFDDGMRSQLEIAVPRLEERGFRGTFYLNPRGDDWQSRCASWLAPYQAGHEIGNHTMAHPCSLNTQLTLQGWTLEQIEADIVETERRLSVLFPANDRSFAYPCYESDIGRGPTRRSYVPVVARHLIAGRGKGLSNRGNHPLNADLHLLSSWAVERMSAWDLIGLVEQCLANGWWGILTIHGINEGHLPMPEVELCALLDYLVRQQGRVWTAPVATVARHILDHSSP